MARTSDYILSGATQDALIPSSEWARRAREILANGRAARAEEERQMRPTSIWPGDTFQTEDIPERPDNWLYNALSDEALNRGVRNLAENASDVILGRESGNPVVDLGTSNIPGVGAASILAAGGMPGIVDAVGMGELKNMKRIPKYTYEFVKEFFGDKGLKNLDNALTKYPKAEKPSVNDALYLMRTGMGGEKVNALKPYSSGSVAGDLGILIGGGRSGEETLKHYRDYVDVVKRDGNEKAIELAERAYQKLLRDVENGDISGGMGDINAIIRLYQYPQADNYSLLVANHALEIPMKLTDFLKDYDGKNVLTDDIKRKFRLLGELDESPIQDWETIAHKQELKNARDIEKQARKQAKEAKTEQPKAEVPLQEKVPQMAQETPKGGTNMWRENGWDPSVRGDVFYGKFGGNLSDESKRDMFVLDSLANHWARQIVGQGKEGKLSEAEIVDALDRADARHKRSNYDEVSQGFYDDLKRNIASGNMPGRSVTFGPKYRKNVITDRDTPTLVLEPEEKPRFYNDVRIWADEQEGPDLYEMVFRPKSDEILNSINPEYWLYRNR